MLLICSRHDVVELHDVPAIDSAIRELQDKPQKGLRNPKR